MITLQYFGHSMIRLSDGERSLVIDPFSDIGYPMPSDLQADIVLCSHLHHDHANVDLVQGSPLVYQKTGSYKVENIEMVGYPSFHDELAGAERGNNIIWQIIWEGLRIVHCGDLGDLPTESVLHALMHADILLIPVGGVYTIGGKEAKNIVAIIEPTITIPIHYWTNELHFPLAPVSDFCEIMNTKVHYSSSPYIVHKAAIREIVVLRREGA